MVRYAYDLLLGLGVSCFLPALLVNKKRDLASAYLGRQLPPSAKSKGGVFLIYAVSVGEVRAAFPLISSIKEQQKGSVIYLATRTRTGLAEAKKSLADHVTLLPFDFSFLMNRFIERISPDVCLVIEGDLWYNLLKACKNRGVFTALVSGKISERSYKRYKKVPFFSRSLFSFFDCVFAQDENSLKRFLSLGALKVREAGNIKQAATFSPLSQEKREALRLSLKVKPEERVVVVGSTHAPEEKMLIEGLKATSDYKTFIVPRHPERFKEVERLLQASGLPFGLYKKLNGSERVVLVNVMGVLGDLYQIADVAVVGGSFACHLQGHNVLEPILSGAATLFGPYMSSQQSMVEKVLAYKAAKQVPFEELFLEINTLLQNEDRKASLQAGIVALRKDVKEAGETSLSRLLSEFFPFVKSGKRSP